MMAGIVVVVREIVVSAVQKSIVVVPCKETLPDGMEFVEVGKSAERKAD